MQDGVMVRDFIIICLLAFFNIFIYLLFFIYLKKRGVQKGVQKRGPEGRVHVLSTPIQDDRSTRGLNR